MDDKELVERLTAPDFWAAHFHGNGSLSEQDEGAPFEAASRITVFREALERAEVAMTCGREDGACYCPNCDNSLFEARAKVRKALSGEESE